MQNVKGYDFTFDFIDTNSGSIKWNIMNYNCIVFKIPKFYNLKFVNNYILEKQNDIEFDILFKKNISLIDFNVSKLSIGDNKYHIYRYQNLMKSKRIMVFENKIFLSKNNDSFIDKSLLYKWFISESKRKLYKRTKKFKKPDIKIEFKWMNDVIVKFFSDKIIINLQIAALSYKLIDFILELVFKMFYSEKKDFLLWTIDKKYIDIFEKIGILYYFM